MIDSKYDPANSTLSTYGYENWFKVEPEDSTVKNEEGEFYDLPLP